MFHQFPYEPKYNQTDTSKPATDRLIQQVSTFLSFILVHQIIWKEQNTIYFSAFLLLQSLRDDGLDSHAKDPKFVAVTKKLMAEAMNVNLDDMEQAAQDIVNGRSGKMPKRKRRPIPVPPSAKPDGKRDATTAV